MSCRALVVVVPAAHGEAVVDHEPTGFGLPRGLDDQPAGTVDACCRHALAVRADPEMARTAVEDCTENAWRIRSGDTHPLDGTTRRDQAGGLTIGEKCVIVDRRKRTPARMRERLTHVRLRSRS